MGLTVLSRRRPRKLVCAVSSLVCTFAFAVFVSPASADSSRHGGHYQDHYQNRHAGHAGPHAHRADRASQRRRHRAQRAPHRARTRAAQVASFRNAHASLMQPQAAAVGSRLVAEARRHIGRNPTGRARLWCARFMNMVLARTGHRGTGSDMARSFASYGRRVSGPQVGAIAVLSRGRRGGHVGVVSGVDARGNPIIISGNHGRRVAEASYPKSRVYAYVMPH